MFAVPSHHDDRPVIIDSIDDLQWVFGNLQRVYFSNLESRSWAVPVRVAFKHVNASVSCPSKRVETGLRPVTKRVTEKTPLPVSPYLSSWAFTPISWTTSAAVPALFVSRSRSSLSPNFPGGEPNGVRYSQ